MPRRQNGRPVVRSANHFKTIQRLGIPEAGLSPRTVEARNDTKFNILVFFLIVVILIAIFCFAKLTGIIPDLNATQNSTESQEK